jgi:hypothetical protein
MTDDNLAKLINDIRCSWPRDWPHGEPNSGADVKTLWECYRKCLEDVDDQDIELLRAAIQKECKFRPASAEILEIYNAIKPWRPEKQFPVVPPDDCVPCPQHIRDMMAESKRKRDVASGS